MIHVFSDCSYSTGWALRAAGKDAICGPHKAPYITIHVLASFSATAVPAEVLGARSRSLTSDKGAGVGLHVSGVEMALGYNHSVT